jgi:hypothetical protein
MIRFHRRSIRGILMENLALCNLAVTCEGYSLRMTWAVIRIQVSGAKVSGNSTIGPDKTEDLER